VAKQMFRTTGVGYKFRFTNADHLRYAPDLDTQTVYVKYDGEHCRRYLDLDGPLLKTPPDAAVTDLGIEQDTSFFVAIGTDGQPTHAVGPCTHEEAVWSAKRFYEQALGGGMGADDLATVDSEGGWQTPDGIRLCVLDPEPFQRVPLTPCEPRP
jgi:hypothetical protein